MERSFTSIQKLTKLILFILFSTCAIGQNSSLIGHDIQGIKKIANVRCPDYKLSEWESNTLYAFGCGHNNALVLFMDEENMECYMFFKSIENSDLQRIKAELEQKHFHINENEWLEYRSPYVIVHELIKYKKGYAYIAYRAGFNIRDRIKTILTNLEKN